MQLSGGQWLSCWQQQQPLTNKAATDSSNDVRIGRSPGYSARNIFLE
jgi:hypothetical protein